MDNKSLIFSFHRDITFPLGYVESSGSHRN